MKKPNIKKLKYPIWFQITFFTLTIVAPLILLFIQGLNSPSKVFRVTFSVVCFAIIIWMFVHRFILKDIETKLKNHKTALEHDYEIEAGNVDKCKWLWFSNELILSVINAVQVFILGALIALIVAGIQEAVLKLKGATLFIATLYLVAYLLKFIIILYLRGEEDIESE